MPVCLLIDLLALLALIHGAIRSPARLRRLLCLGCLIYLLDVAGRLYLGLAPWFGLLRRHRSLAAIGLTELLNLFGGFWTFFGVMVLARGVSYIALVFLIYEIFAWRTGIAGGPAGSAARRLTPL